MFGAGQGAGLQHSHWVLGARCLDPSVRGCPPITRPVKKANARGTGQRALSAMVQVSFSYLLVCAALLSKNNTGRSRVLMGWSDLP